MTATTKPARQRLALTSAERAFVLSMYRAGVANCRGWLSPDQIAMADRLSVALEGLPIARTGKPEVGP